MPSEKATRMAIWFGRLLVDLLEFQMKQPLKAKKRGRPFKISLFRRICEDLL
jgi:hypothetical protein